MNTTDLLTERHATHGSFASNAHYGQTLRALFRTSPGWERMPDEHREALDMVACKLSRILSGNSMEQDHWADLAGYSELARKACKR
jgi:hypothetical protein